MFQNINYNLVSASSHKEIACSTFLIISVKSTWKGSILVQILLVLIFQLIGVIYLILKLPCFEYTNKG